MAINDVIHYPPRHTIYEQTVYITGSDMSIPFAAASTMVYGIASEIGRRPGFPQVNRGNIYSPLIMAGGFMPLSDKEKGIHK